MVVVDYAKTKIYQINNTINDEVYVGSTTNTLEQRLTQHRHRVSKECFLHLPLYSLMRELGTDKFYIELVEDYPCTSRLDQRVREGYYIRERGTLNQRIAGRDKSEYRHENIDRIKETRLEYRKNNADILKEKWKQYYKENRAKILQRGSEYRNNNPDRSKDYYQTNRDNLLEQKAEYYFKNKELISSKAAVKVECEKCGCMIRRSDIAKHQKTKKCNLLAASL